MYVCMCVCVCVVNALDVHQAVRVPAATQRAAPQVWSAPRWGWAEGALFGAWGRVTVAGALGWNIG